MNILVIEDETRVAELIKRGLEEQGYKVTLTYDGGMGKKLALSKDYNLIITDIILPKINGLDLPPSNLLLQHSRTGTKMRAMVKLIYSKRDRSSLFITSKRDIKVEEVTVPYIIFALDEKFPSFKLQLNKAMTFSFYDRFRKRGRNKSHVTTIEFTLRLSLALKIIIFEQKQYNESIY